ncbi:NACHT domain-containing protein [Clostridium perfringens]|uniref:NACHT domain-containing protein n=1 Tax=Clostridium perfringens TaxID=1502 RepID=UPI0039E9CC67
MRKLIIGRILRNGKPIGTGFLISPDIFMTVKHNVIVADDLLGDVIEEKEVVIEFLEDDVIIGKTINLQEAHDKGIDCVFIRLNEVLCDDELQVLIIPNNNLMDYKCGIIDYPKLMQGRIELSGEIINDIEDEILIYVKKEEQLQNYEGISGAPVIVSEYVVGIVTRQENNERLEALPIKHIINKLNYEEINIDCKVMSLNCKMYDFDLKEIQRKSRQIILSAGPRYSRELNIKTGIYNNISFLLKKDCVKQRISVISEKIGESIKKLFEFNSYNESEKNLVLENNRNQIVSIISQLQNDFNIIDKILQKNVEIQKLLVQLEMNKQKIEEIFEIEKGRFEERYGDGTYNNKSWRGFMASYMCVFPAQYLDKLKETILIFQEIIRLLDLNLLNDIDNRTILITGKGGIGKTHLLCDIVNGYLERELPAILLLGEMFNVNETPDSVIMNVFRKGEDIENLFSWLNEYGNKNNLYIPICIDAINETQDNMYWNNNLPLLLAKLENFHNIKIIISCRSIYLEEYLDDDKMKNILQIQHNGFDQIEVDALSDFCKFYGVTINYNTTCIPEFMNPLFLKMLCEISKSKEDKMVVLEDIQTLMDEFFNIKNKIISKKYMDYFSVRDNVVILVLNSITEYMADNDIYNISWKDLRIIVSDVLDEFCIKEKTAGFIKLLISENLLRESDEDSRSISFGYQKFYEYLYAKKYSNEKISSIIDAVENRKITLGTLEIIQIEFYKRNKEEFLSKIDNRIHGEAVESFMSGLYWRRENEIGEKTIIVLESLIHENQEADIRRIILGLLAISTKMNCAFNAYYIHEKLKVMDNYRRDYLLSFFLLKQYDNIKVLSDLCERAIYLDKTDISEESILLWKIILCWGTGSNDIKLRDKASKGLTNLFRLYPSDMINIIIMFDDVNDDYIQERIWQSIYSTLIILAEQRYINPILEYVEENIVKMGKWPQNVLIRDYLRNIFEYAHYKNWCTNETVNLVRPPYISKKHSLNKEWISSVEKSYSNLFWNCQDSDFAIYTIPSDVENYGITKKEVGLLIFEDIVKSGYVSSWLADYDDYIDYTFGSLRNRDEQIERIGKKYQKIYLYREMGNIYDNYTYSPRYRYNEIEIVQSEQGNSFRKIDLTTSSRKNDFKGKRLEYPFFRFKKWTDLNWFKNNDIEKYILKLFNYKYYEEEYYILQGYSSVKEQGKKEFREIWVQIRTYFYEKDKKQELLDWLKNKDFEGRWMPEGYNQLYQCCVGEYPWSPIMVNYLGQDESQDFKQEMSLPCYLYTTVNDYLTEKDSPFCIEISNSYMFPTKYLFEKMNLSWNGLYGYISNGKAVIYNGQNNTIYINKQFLQEFLNENNLDIVWTVLGEKQKITGNFGMDFPGRGEFSYSYFLNQNEILTKNHELFNVLNPKKRN